MVDIKFIEDFLLNNFKIQGQYEILNNGVVNIYGNLLKLHTFPNEITELPITFGFVNCVFHLDYTDLESLKGCPNIVGYNRLEDYCSIVNNNNLKSLRYSPISTFLDCSDCDNLESLDYLNCEIFFGNNLNLKRVGINFYAKEFVFNNFPTPTADEMRRFIQLNPVFDTEQEAPWITLINDYYEHKDLFKAIGEFEELYNEPWMNTEDRIEIIPSSNGLSL